VPEKQQQLEWEARAGRLAGFASWFAAALIVVGLGYRIVGLPHGADNVQEFLPEVHAHESAFLVSGILTAVGMLAFIPPLFYLYNATRYRRPELPSVTRILIFLGPIVFAICSVWFQFRQAHAADQFVAGTVKTKKHAEDLLRDSTTAVAGLSLGASIGTGLATILVSMNAMRAGLLSRFMGVLGVILGALFVLPLIASPIIQVFWLLALGALFLNLWPGGRGPAWETGEPEPWPSAQGRFGPPAEEDDEEEEEPEPEREPEPAAANPRSSRKRRKKKARR
jgi:cytochrome bd-type quinol oxidase subunit 2